MKHLFAPHLPVMTRLCRAMSVGLVTLSLVAFTSAGPAEAAGPASHGPTATTVPIADYPGAVQVSPDQRYAYVAATGDDVVSVVDLRTRTLTADVAVGNRPLAVAFDAVGTTAYVANSGSGTISVIDTRTRRVVRTLAVGGSPSGLVVVTRNHAEELFVADFAGSRVRLVHTKTGSVLHQWSVLEPAGVVATADGSVVAPSSGDNSVLIINSAHLTVNTMHRPDGSVTNPGSLSASGNTVALPGDDTTWLNTGTRTFRGALAPIAPGQTSGSAVFGRGAFTLLTTRTPGGDDGPAALGKLSLIRTRTQAPLSTVAVGISPSRVAVTRGLVLVTEGPAANGQFDLLILPWSTFLTC